MNRLKWWMRAVGAMFLFLFVAAAILKLPIQTEGPAGVLAQAAAGDPTAKFVVDTWVTLGIWYGVLGIVVLISSRKPESARVLAWTVVGWEAGGIVIDIYKLTRGYEATAPMIWMAIHTVVIITGVWILRKRFRTSVI